MARAVPVPPEGERPVEEKSIPELIRQIVQESSDLVREEFELFRQETAITLRETGIATGKLAAGAVLLILAVGFLGFSLIVLLSLYITPWVSALIVGLAFLLVGAIVAYAGRRDFQTMQVASQTRETLKEDAEWLRHPTRPEER